MYCTSHMLANLVLALKTESELAGGWVPPEPRLRDQHYLRAGWTECLWNEWGKLGMNDRVGESIACAPHPVLVSKGREAGHGTRLGHQCG